MRFTSLNICGFRGFNDAQTLDLSDPIAVFEGPNGSGKTSIGEAMEWLLYGKTLKRTKGDELSKREYDGCYKNTHYSGAALPFVEATLEDQTGRSRTIRRELKTDETSTLKVDGAVAQDLEAFGIDTVYDRPLILQHTLQDFIFMKPKARYEVLSAMMGLEPLITFRNTVEAAKTEFGRRLPVNVTQAQNRRLLLVEDMRQEAVLVPVATLIDSGNLGAAKVHLQQIAQGLVQADTADADLLPALRIKKAERERAQIDWGRFSGAIINSPAQNPAITHLAMLEGRVTQLRRHLRDAAATTTPAAAPAREQDPQRRQFYHLGIHLLDAAHPANCPFCANESLTPERIAAIREAVAEKPEGVSAIQQALAEVRGLNTDLMTQVGEARRLVPNFPEDADELKIRTIVETGAASYLESITVLRAQLALFSEAFERLHESQQAVEAALSAGDIPEGGGEDLSQVLAAYAAAVCEIPGLINAYAANYTVFDPVIRAHLSSAADVKKIERAIRALEQWKDVEITQRARSAEKGFTDLIGAIRAFTEKKQRQVLASRDQEIKAWYAMLNPVSDVAYDGIVTGTDKLELWAKTFAKTMPAAPNLSTSQLNCLGLSVYLACATRRGTPFKTLLIDDPVQSMDDEHTEAFKKQVIDKLLNDGHHAIVLTHMRLLAGDIESLYRRRGAVLYKMRQYSRSGPSIEWKGPEIGRLLEAVRRNKDSNEQYRKQATLDLRIFIELFAKDLFKAQTGGIVSKRYEDRTWNELKELLKRCNDFDANDEPKLEDTYSFTSRHLHPDDRMPQPVPSGAQITAHYTEMNELLDNYKPVLGMK